MKTPVRTERLTLRPLGPQDFDAVWEMASDEGLVRMKATWPYPPDEAFTRARLANDHAASGRVSAIVHGTDTIGTVAVTGGTLGYVLRRAWWGRGFATEAVRAKVAQAFRLTDLDVLTAGAWVDNPASHRVLAKVGFVEVGRSRDFCAGRGGEVDGIDFALTRLAWAGQA